MMLRNLSNVLTRRPASDKARSSKSCFLNSHDSVAVVRFTGDFERAALFGHREANNILFLAANAGRDVIGATVFLIHKAA